MYLYVAYSKNARGEYSNRLCSVYADDEKSAQREVERQLEKPGRRAYLYEWRVSGRYVRRS